MSPLKKKYQHIIFFFFFFSLWNLGFLDQRFNPCPLYWERRVLTSGMPRKSPKCLHFYGTFVNTSVWGNTQRLYDFLS